MHKIFIQRIERHQPSPPVKLLRAWVKCVLPKVTAAELTIRIVGKTEMMKLNATYRHKPKPTNVLAFPYTDMPLLGDIVICAEVVNQEAIDQGKSNEAHWAHIVIHGTLHLLGYDHEQASAAEVMEKQEIDILKALGFANPYQSERSER